MRISTSTIFDSNVALLGQQQAQLLHTQQQIATQRKILTPSDDPVGAANALAISQADAINTRYTANRAVVSDKLTMAEGYLQSVTSLLQDVHDAALNAGSSSLNNNGRKTIATDLSGRLQELVGLANSKDGLGNYLFAGFQSKTQPFANTPAGTGYFGDDGPQNVQVSASRQVASNDSGANLFMRIKNGNGAFMAQATASNTGSGIVSTGNVINPPPTVAQQGNQYTVTFSVLAGVTTYSVTGKDSTGAALPTGGQPAALPAAVPYVSGQAISFNGIQFDIKGAPADGDKFTVSPSANESIFKTISDLIAVLNTPVVGASTNLTNSLNTGLNQLDNVLTNVLNVRASIGSRLNEIDALQTWGNDLGVQLKQSLSKLQDIDYTTAVSQLNQQQLGLQAAQQSFAKISALSLFAYL